MKKAFAMILALSLLLVAMAGCASDPAPTAAPTEAPETEATTEAPTEAHTETESDSYNDLQLVPKVVGNSYQVQKGEAYY